MSPPLADPPWLHTIADYKNESAVRNTVTSRINTIHPDDPDEDELGTSARRGGGESFTRTIFEIPGTKVTGTLSACPYSNLRPAGYEDVTDYTISTYCGKV